MKIAVFYNLQVSGAKRVVFDQVKWLRKLNHVVDVYTIKPQDELFNPSGFASNMYLYTYSPAIINLPLLKRLTEDIGAFTTLKKLHKKISEDINSKDYDIALIHTDKFTQAPFVLQFLKIKNVYFCLEPLRMVYEYSLRVSENLSAFNKIYESINRSIRKNIDRKNARSAYTSTAISYFGREFMIQAFDLYPKVSYLCIDTEIFRPINVRKKNQILFVGQKLGLNGYEFALKAMELIPKEIRPELKIISWTSNRKDRLTDEELVREYNQSLITFSLSTYDTFGLVALESLACKTPVIAFNTAGYRETMINEKTGYLVDFSAKEIAEKSIKIIKDKKLRETMGEFGKSWVDSYWSWEKRIKELEQLLKKISK